VSESIDIKVKQAVIALADELDYALAAERLKINSAALRELITQLEKTLCLHIFRPRQKRVELTEDGTFLVRVFREAVALHDRNGGNPGKGANGDLAS
jgi:DNA-binding transcriptional LysR family regulator